MSIQDKIASALLREHEEVLHNFDKRAGGWITRPGELQEHLERSKRKEYKKATVQFDVSADRQPKLICAVADTPELQVLGLQNHQGLGRDEGMIFPQPEPRKVTFHMGAVAFPIDIMYVGSDGRIGRIEANVEPNTAGAWSHPHVISVIEAPGGWAKKNGVEIGTFVGEVVELQAQLKQFDPQTNQWQQHPVLTAPPRLKGVPQGTYGYDPMGTPSNVRDQQDQFTDIGLEPTQISPTIPQKPDMPWDTQTPTVPPPQPNGPQVPAAQANANKSFVRLQRLLEAQERFTPDPRKDINPKMMPFTSPTTDRYRSKDLPDEVWRRLPIDDSNWQEQFGYDPARNLQDDENVPAIRPAPGP